MQISQKAIIKKDDKYLILLRSDKHPIFADHWDFPGGRLDEGETLEEGLKREVMEETTLEVEIGGKIFEYDMVVVDRPTQFYIYDVKRYSGDVVLSKDHTEYKWATKEEILELQTFPYIKPFFENL